MTDLDELERFIRGADQVERIVDGRPNMFGPGGDELKDELLALIAELREAREEIEVLIQLVPS